MSRRYSKREFKYSVVNFLKLIEERPCIWDRTIEEYKDHSERKRAWKEIMANLDGSFDEMTQGEKLTLEDMLITKWTNMKDAFVKSIKNRMSTGSSRQYIYHNEISFLKKIFPFGDIFNNDTIVSRKEMKNDMQKIEKTEQIYFEEDSHQSSNEEIINKEYLQLQYEEPDSRVMNEDEAFFASLLPTVVQYSLEDRLEFRMEVLGVMKKINAKRKRTDDDDD